MPEYEPGLTISAAAHRMVNTTDPRLVDWNLLDAMTEEDNPPIAEYTKLLDKIGI